MKPDPKSIEHAAADWLARSEAGLTATDEARLQAWLAADVRHAESYRALAGSWSRLDRLRGSGLATRLEEELDDVARAQATRRSRAWPWVSGALAASLVWLVAYFAWWRPAQATSPYAETAATEIGAVRTMALPDGSTLRLNTNSAVEIFFTKTERRVRLARGEVLFQVAKNRRRPFIVSAAGVDVRAVGTEFNVRMHSAAVDVIVREGAVRVDDRTTGATLLAPAAARSGAVPVLGAGQRVTIPVVPLAQPAAVAARPVSLPSVEIERSLAWQNGRLVFDSAPLSAIVAEFNRYNRRQLVIADEQLAARRFGGTFVAADPATFVELLRGTADVAVEEHASEIVLRGRR